MRSTQRKTWSQLSTAQKSSLVALGLIQLALLIAALLDIRRRTTDEINGSKRLWTAALFINYIGPLAYFLFGRRRNRAA